MDSNNNSTYSTTQKKLVVAEKPSVAKSIAKVLGADERKDGYMEGNGFIVSWCVGHLVELAQPDAYSDAWKKWTYDSLPMIPEHWQHEVKKDTVAQYRVDASLQEQYPQIIGVTLNNPTAGQTVTAVNQTTLDAVLTLFSELDGTGILEHVASVNVEKEYDMVVQYDDRYEIDLGSSDRLAYKVQYLQAILEQLSDFQAGTIDLTLSEANRAKFHPKA